MVVEDSVTQREMICGLLKENGLQVSIATDGVEALEEVQKKPPRFNGARYCYAQDERL